MYKNSNFKKRKIFFTVLFILYFITLMYIILLKFGEGFIVAEHMSQFSIKEKISFIQIIPFKTIIDFLNKDYTSSISNVLGNILIFTPLGFLLPILSEKFKKAKNLLIISFLVSFSIELIQLFSGLGFTDIDDIILNVTGAILGFYIYKCINKILKLKYKEDSF